MNKIITILKENILERKNIFVFPSEITAAFWMHKSLLLTDKTAVRAGRFISWDKFKEKAFNLNRKEKPVNIYSRVLFASAVLEENRGKAPVFNYLIHKEHADNSFKFLNYLVGIFPRLNRLLESDSLLLSGLEKELVHDLITLQIRYKNFLELNNLYEPSWKTPELDPGDMHYYIFFPDVITDIDEYLPDLNNSSSITVDASGKDVDSKILLFENAFIERKWILNKIAELLEEGISVEDIAVTVPEKENQNRLITEAELYNLPLDIRAGKPLLSYREAGFFNLIYECSATGFSLESLKALLLSGAFPWKDRKTGRNLVSFGIQYCCIRNWNREKGRTLWQDTLKRFGDIELQNFFKALYSGIKKIVDSGSFSALKMNILIFVSSFFNKELWEESSIKIFQFCIDSINDLLDAEKQLKGIVFQNHYSIWLSILAGKIYVPRSKNPGIPVFSYRVSAGIAPAYHFISGASHDSTEVKIVKYPFLRDDQKDALNAADKDISDAFIKLYGRSGGRVFFSFGKEDYDGPMLAPGYFVSRDRVEVFNKMELLKKEDSLCREEETWSDVESVHCKMLPVQRNGFFQIARTAFIPKGLDLTKSCLEDADLVESLYSKQKDEEGCLSISPSSLDNFRGCPFAYLLSRSLKIEDKEYSIALSNPVKEGELMHNILKNLFKKIKQNDGVFCPDKVKDYKELLNKIINESFFRLERRESVFIKPVCTAVMRKITEELSFFLENEKEAFPEYRIETLEEKYTYRDNKKKILLTGKIDRVSSKNEEYLVIDYKKRNRLKKSDFINNEDIITSFQIPFYVFLLKAVNKNVTQAVYYGIEDRGYNYLVSENNRKSWMRIEDMEELINNLAVSVSEMTNRIRSGDYRINRNQCDPCAYRGVCRTKFIIR